MGLLGKVLGTGIELMGAGVDALYNGIVNVFQKREKQNLEYLAKYPFINKFIIREVKEIQNDMSFAEEFGVKKNFFVAYTQKNSPIYLAYSEEGLGKCTYTLVDMAANEIAVLVAKNQRCSIEYRNVKCELKSSNLFDKRKFTLDNSEYKIESNDLGTEIKICNRNRKMQINKVASDLGMKWGEYVVGCNQSDDSLFIILLGIAIGTILMRSANLLEAD